MLVSTICIGHQVTIGGATFTVYGALKARRSYRYLLAGPGGEKRSVQRAELLRGQLAGTMRVTATA